MTTASDDINGVCVCGVTDEQFAAAGGVAQWRTKDLTYAVVGFLPVFTQSEYRQIVRAAFDAWENVCGIRADETTSTSANIVISAGRGRRVNFDGPSGVLAWCELPVGANPQQVRLMMDLDETWVTNGNGIHVPNVLCHELGHGLGLEHIQNAKALMNPIYDVNTPRPLPPDVAQVVQRYGDPRPRNPQAPPPTNKTPIALTVGGRVQWSAYVEDLRP